PERRAPAVLGACRPRRAGPRPGGRRGCSPAATRHRHRRRGVEPPSGTKHRDTNQLGDNDVPPRARKSAEPPSADLKDTLWKAAALRSGSSDAAEYKHFVLGLIFLKYPSDAFDERCGQVEAELEAEGIPEANRATILEDKDEYTGRGVFWVPPAARWESLAHRAKTGAGQTSIGQLLDGAIKTVGDANPDLKGAL